VDPSTQGRQQDPGGTARHARVDLGATVAPLERAVRFGDAVGAEVWLQREDVGALGGGGNKLRKLEFLLGAALERGCDTVVTFGALQSNHARQTAAACARLGLRCELVLTRAVPRAGEAFEQSGNVLLDRLFGAGLTIVDHDDAELELAVAGLRTRLRDEGRVVAWIPPGGSDATGTLGWVRGGVDLAGRLGDVGIDRATIVVAVSTGGTVAGLRLGLARSGRRDRVLGVCVYRSRERTAEVVDQLMRDTAALLDPPRSSGGPPAVTPIELTDEFLGAGYGLPTPAMRAAVELLARTEGIAADPVYSGKALAAVVERCRLGRLGHRDGRDEPVVVVLTGGGPGLYAYPDVFGPEPSGD
jgi:1-aminocyclopropane-1-carboxylate deaminase/D-cysteine desulfhydrase-like pyridoxal-dependent ACC family enzyme